MHPDIKRLVELQAVDTRLSTLRSRLASFPQQLAEIDTRLSHARQQIAAAKEALTGSLKDRKTYEMDVDSWKEKARKYKEQSFAVKTNEAYKALQSEVQHAEGQVAQAEDRLLERMVAGEDFERQVKAAERELVAIERVAAAERQKIEAERADLQKDLEAKTAERQQEISSIPEKLFEQYEVIAQHRHGVGLAEVRDEACTLCGVRIRPHVFQKLRRDEDAIFQCETCTRILYYIEPPPPATESADAKSTAAGATSGHGNEE
jgi:predicted  nucleic acid-binding Zn-ribbon protein